MSPRAEVTRDLRFMPQRGFAPVVGQVLGDTQPN